MSCWLVGDLAAFVSERFLHHDPFAALAGAGGLAFYPIATWALLSFHPAGGRRRDRTALHLDALIVVLCAAVGLWFLVAGPVVQSHLNAGPDADGGSETNAGMALLFGVAYPVGDLLILFGVVVHLLRGITAGDRGLRILVVALCGRVLADVAAARLFLAGGYDGVLPDAFAATTWCLFLLVVTVAVRATAGDAARAGSPRQSDGHPSLAGSGRSHPRPDEPHLARLPRLAVAAAYALLLFAGQSAVWPLGDTPYPGPLNGLLLAAAAIMAAVLARGASLSAENRRLTARLRNVASVDPLTRIPNRRAFFEAAELLFENPGVPAGDSRCHSVVMIDVDYFKEVNDTYGHSTGDRVLSAVAAGVKSQLRSADIVGRYGGDELVIALAGCDAAAAVAVAERIHSVVAATPILTDDGVVNITLSVGVAGSEDGEGILAVLARADLALYEAKRAGRACVRQFTSSTNMRSL